jgi:hypothetical protein
MEVPLRVFYAVFVFFFPEDDRNDFSIADVYDYGNT